MKTTPIAAMDILVNLLPIETIMMGEARTGYRTKKNMTDSNTRVSRD